MRQDVVQNGQQGDGSLLPVPSPAAMGPAPSSIGSSSSFETVTKVESYFDIPRDGVQSPNSDQSDASIPMLATPTHTVAALAALQYLPVPVLVLDSLKTVLLANDAMGRLLGIDPSELESSAGPVASISDVLRGKSMSQLGIDILAHGSPVWIGWEDFLDGVVDSAPRPGQHADSGQSSPSDNTHSGNTTPRAPQSSEFSISQSDPSALNSGTVVDAQVEVVISSYRERASVKSRSDHKVTKESQSLQATMITSAWKIEDAMYFTLTFTASHSTEQVPAPARRAVTRSTTIFPRPLGSSGSASSGRRSLASSNHSASNSSISSPMLSTPSFPPLGPPTSSIGSKRSLFQKASRLKDAILNSVNMPAYAMWKDETFGIPNKALLSLHPNADGHAEHAPEDQREFLAEYTVWTEDFKQELNVDEFPIIELCRSQKRFDSRRVGMKHPKTNQKLVYDVMGEPIFDDNSNEFLGGIVMFKDVTEYTKRIAEQIEENEKQFEYIANLIPIMVWRTTPDGMHDWFSQRWYEYTGLTEEESLGAGWRLPFHPDDMPATAARWKHSLNTGEEYITEYRCQRQDGQWRWMLGRAVPFLNDRNEIVKWFGTCTDIHDLVQARQTAKETREQLSRVIEHAQVTLWAINMQREITLFEGSMLSSGTNDKSYYVGRNIDDALGDTGLQQSMDKVLNGMSKEELVEFHIKDGDRWFRSRLLPLYVKSRAGGIEGKAYIDGLISVSVDATELRLREHELKEQEAANSKLLANEAAAKEASKMKSQFLANMSHEIRTPIAGVIGMSELLLDTNLDDEQKEFAENVNRSANSLLTVINDILDFSKVESGRLDIEDVQFNLSVVIRDISKMSAFAAQRKNLTYKSFIEPLIAKDFKVMGDPGRLRQIVQNLLTNSLKFTNQGSISLSVTRMSETKDIINIQFEVQDTGIGIEEEVRKKLFKPFSQADSSTARRFGGTGLGLTISKNLVELMNGKIELESKLGSGTTARFWLPFKRTPNIPHDEALVDLSSIPDRLQSEISVSWSSNDADRTPPTTPPVYNLRNEPLSRGEMVLGTSTAIPDEYLSLSPDSRGRIHVLVVEDNPINQQIALKTIKKLGFSVNAVWNGQEVLDYLLKEPSPAYPRPDIILMDVQMPIMDGYRATHTIRTQEPYRDRVRDIPIVAMTASAIQGDKEKCQKAGMDDYLSKPVRGSVLEKMLIKWTSTERQAAGVLSRQESLSVESDYSLEGIGHSRSHSPASGPSAPFSKGHFQGRSTSPMHHIASQASSTLAAGARRGSNLAFIENAAIESAGDSEVVRQHRRLQSEEKALSLRDAKMLSATENPRDEQGSWRKEEGQKRTGPSHPLTPGNLSRHLSEQTLSEEARVGKTEGGESLGTAGTARKRDDENEK